MLQTEGIINSQDDLIPIINQLEPQGKRVEAISQDLKKYYREEIINHIVNPDTKLMEQKYPNLPWNNNPTEAYNQARHQEMMRIVDQLNSGDKGYIAETWYQAVYGKGRGSTQVEISKEEMAQQGVEISQKRRPDEIFGDTIREQKTVADRLDNEERLVGQFNDYIKIASKPGGSKITAKDGKQYTVTKLMYSLIDPKGVQVNAKWMLDKLGDHENLSFEIFNSQGERKIINRDNQNELKNPALSRWLGL